MSSGRMQWVALTIPQHVQVSVIIPVYNAEHTIARAIDSVLAQQFDSIEIIAVDDGSTDASFAILDGYCDRIGTDRMKIRRQRNCGAASARNAGARLATGEYLAFLDADDEWLPGKLRACVGALGASPDAVVAYSDTIGIDGQSSRRINGSPSLEYLLNGWFALLPSAAVIRRRIFETCGGFSESFGRGDLGEDTYLALRLRELGEFVHVAEPLVMYRDPSSCGVSSKYPRGHRTFVRLTKERYGRRSRGVRTHIRRYFSSVLFVTALHDLREHGVRTALPNLAKALKVSPGFVSSCVFNKARTTLRARFLGREDQ